MDLLQIIPKSKLNVVTTSVWDKSVSTVAVRTQKKISTIDTFYPSHRVKKEQSDRFVFSHTQASKTKVGSVNKLPNLASSTTNVQVKSGYPSSVSTVSQLIPLRSSSTIKLAGAFPSPMPRATAPRLVAAGNVRCDTRSNFFSRI